MHTLTHFRMLAYGIDLAPLCTELDAAPELWGEITGRQEYPGSPHKDTESIYLRAPARLESPADLQEDLAAHDTPAMDRLPSVRNVLMPILERLGAKYLGRVALVKLHPGGEIDPHIDQGSYAKAYSRFHIPIESADGNAFFIEDEVARMLPGTCWWINHRREHRVVNRSDRPRTHLIFDAVLPYDVPEFQDEP